MVPVQEGPHCGPSVPLATIVMWLPVFHSRGRPNSPIAIQSFPLGGHVPTAEDAGLVKGDLWSLVTA